ncbi:MAG TPA: alpha-amylase family glycosyl hydrolase, partial [Candidatus Paceibacterota bacterium]|nr:alpha-amylase family glycosyl hydrolase [Candidatus Paceibacterota bacterium]
MNNPAHTDRHCFKRIPGATYRLQFNRQFTFRHAAEILDYLAELGVTDIYASPWFQAGPNSTHGYDVCCFGEISSALGSAEDFERFNSRRHELGLGLLLDMVPNHMGADLSNDWWLDVLEHGPKSKFAGFFDIDWQPVTPSLRNKVLLPVLGDHYGKVLERGEIRLGFGDGRFFLGYLGRKFPVTPGSLPASIDQSSMAVEQILAEFNGIPGQPETFDRLHGLVQRQHYRLACWRVGSEEINYRRFFDVTELVALRMECPEVFAASHELLFEWLEPGIVTGLRIDHPDGLRDPAQYLGRLQSKAAECLKPSGPLYIVVEKILSGDESLPDDWPVDGTTGYDFLNRVND